jgi:hypothetical protein
MEEHLARLLPRLGATLVVALDELRRLLRVGERPQPVAEEPREPGRLGLNAET